MSRSFDKWGRHALSASVLLAMSLVQPVQSQGIGAAAGGVGALGGIGGGAGAGGASGGGMTGGFSGSLSGVPSAGGAVRASGLGGALAPGLAGEATPGGGMGMSGQVGSAEAAAAAAAGSERDASDAAVFRQRNSDGQRRPLAALDPNDFQRFIQAGTGRLLPMFGANLFQSAPASFAPNEAVPVPADYVIGPGDELVIRTTGVLEFDLRPTVDREGQIVIPKVGAVSVAGVKRADLEKYLTQQVSRTLRNFTLSATLGQLRSIDIYVVGQARRPGKYTLSSLSTLVNALFASGGPNANGSMRRVRLVRADRSTASIDLYDFIVKGDKSKDVKLLPGDVIVFPPSGPRVAISGAINVPAIYELISNETPVSEVLALSGGLPVLATPLKAQLERIDPSRAAPRSVEDFPLDAAGQGRRLRDGDLLTIFSISPRFENAVTLRGNVAAPLRYPFKPGMRVRDLIPEPEALIASDYYIRKNVAVQFANEGMQVSVERSRQDVRTMLDEVNWDYAVVERLDPVDLKTVLIPFNLGAAVLKNDASQDLELKPGDTVTVFSKRDMQVPQSRQTRMVRVEGEVGAPGIYTVAAGETLLQLIARVGGTTGDAYLFGTELTRESVKRLQTANLETVVRRLEDQMGSDIATRQASLGASSDAGAAVQQARIANEERLARQRLQRLRSMKPSGRVALELDANAPVLPPLPLEDGDRVIVPPKPSFVSVVGAVYNENVLLWRSGRTVRAYLDSAGLTESAEIDNVFVLRADGSIASRKDRSWFDGKGIEELALAPGDTVVVPEKADRETRYAAFMRNLKDWTQVVYQLGLGAAAIKVLRD